MAITESYEQQGRQGQPGQHHLPPDAVAILKADHDLVESLFAQCEQAEGNGLANTTPLTRQVFQALQLHTTIEEECVYPPWRGRRSMNKGSQCCSNSVPRTGLSSNRSRV